MLVYSFMLYSLNKQLSIFGNLRIGECPLLGADFEVAF